MLFSRNKKSAAAQAPVPSSLTLLDIKSARAAFEASGAFEQKPAQNWQMAPLPRFGVETEENEVKSV